MKAIGSLEGLFNRPLAVLLAPAIILVSMCAAPVYGQRVFGLDTSSAANNDVSQAQWDAAYNSGWSAAGIPSCGENCEKPVRSAAWLHVASSSAPSIAILIESPAMRGMRTRS